jgi:outer membrane protein TolC
VLKRAEALASEGAQVQVEAIRAQSLGRRRAMAQLHQQGDAAAAKLAYLLGLGPDVQLVPADSALRPVELADASQPLETLVGQALSAGPGVRELERMLAVIQGGIDRANGPGRFLPVVELRTLETGMFAGKNSTYDSANRFDAGVQMRWNLSDLFRARDQRRIASSKLAQAHLSYEELRARLALGVEEAKDTIEGSRTQLRLCTEQIDHACRAYRLSDTRLRTNVPGSSTSEVTGAIQLLEMAHLNSLGAIREYNKAQVRLMILLGAAGGPCGPAH